MLRKVLYTLSVVAILTGLAFPNSKQDVETLKQQLAISQAALTKAANERAAMEEQVKALTAATKQQSEAATTRGDAAAVQRQTVIEQGVDVRHAQNENAGLAQQAAAGARDANAQAVLAAISAKAEQNALMITQVSGVITLLCTFLWKAYADQRNHNWLVEERTATASATAAHRAIELAKLDLVQVEATRAYETANHVNDKIASLGVKLSTPA